VWAVIAAAIVLAIIWLAIITRSLVLRRRSRQRRHPLDAHRYLPELRDVYLDQDPALGPVIRRRALPEPGPELDRLVRASDLSRPRRPRTPGELAGVAAQVRHRWLATRQAGRTSVPLDDLLGTPGWNGDHRP
jgi:hypothetical protein